jgi:hypothetical protein
MKVLHFNKYLTRKTLIIIQFKRQTKMSAAHAVACVATVAVSLSTRS